MVHIWQLPQRLKNALSSTQYADGSIPMGCDVFSVMQLDALEGCPPTLRQRAIYINTDGVYYRNFAFGEVSALSSFQCLRRGDACLDMLFSQLILTW